MAIFQFAGRTFRTCAAVNLSSSGKCWKLVWDYVQPLPQWPRLAVEVDEHELRPGFTSDLGKADVLVPDLREVPPAGDLGELAVEVPRPAVESTHQLAGASGAGPQLATPMQTGVVIGLDLVLGRADDEHRPVTDVVDEVVSDVRDVLQVAGPMPHPGPHTVVLAALVVG
jgi:hypothetical protein